MIFLSVGTRMPLQTILAGDRSKNAFFLASISSAKKRLSQVFAYFGFWCYSARVAAKRPLVPGWD